MTEEAGQRKLDSATAKADQAVALTAPRGQEPLRQSSASRGTDLAALSGRIDQAVDQSEKALEKWEAYDDACKKLSDWLRDAEASLAELEEPGAYLDDKKERLEKLRVIL